MTTEEFSNEFDTLLNSYSKVTQGFELALDEYEKSVLLTKAQEEIVKELYTGLLTGKPFEHNEEVRRGLDALLKTKSLEQYEDVPIGLSLDSQFYKLPEDIWFITYEQATITDSSLCEGKACVKVVPMRQDEWSNSKDNPFRKPNKNKVIRLDYSSELIEVISDYAISEYLIKYLSKPTPIILTQLYDDVKIEGEQNITECKLNSALHRVILERAVQLAYKRIPQSKSN